MNNGSLDKQLFNNLAKLKQEIQHLEDVISERIDEIWNLIYEGFGKQKPVDHRWWWSDDKMPSISLEDDEDEFQFSIVKVQKLVTDYFDYTFGFPTKFLITPNEEIVQIIKDQCQKTLDRKKSEENKRLTKKADKQSLVERALSKLTPEEKAALNLK